MIIFLLNDDEVDFVENLYIKHSNTLWRYINSVIKDADKTNEILQLIYLKIVKYINTVKQVQAYKMEAYLIGMAKNAIADFLNEPIEYILYDDEINAVSKDDFQPKYEYDELHEIVEHLPSKYRLLIQLKYFYDFTNIQISKILNISPESVRTYKMRAIRIVKERLSGKNYE